MSKLVSLDYLDDYNIFVLSETFSNIMTRLDLNTMFKPKMKLLIKVCLPDAVSQDLAESTHPAVVRAVVDYFSNKGIKCIVADCPNTKHSLSHLDEVYLNTGMLEMANLTKCDLNRDLSTVDIEIPEGVMTKGITVLDLVNQVDGIINIGKLKINENLGYCGACSNMFTLIPNGLRSLILNRMENLGDLNNYIIDVLMSVKDKLMINIVDAVVAQEADKTQRMLNCLGVSECPFCLDAAMCDILGIKYDNTILKQAKQRELFVYDKPYKIVGEKIEKFVVEDFALAEFDCSKPIKTSRMYFKLHQQRPFIDKNKCKGCKICSKICPTNAIMMKYDNKGELFAEIDYKKCIFCNKCITACPYRVIEQITPYAHKKLEKELKKYNNQED